MTLVLDASALVAALVDTGPDGTWAETLLVEDALAGPHLLPVETANVLRRAALRGEIGSDSASLAHADLLDVRVELFDYAPFADRVWALRPNLSAYDAWYVAVAERLGAPLATLDRRLAASTGPDCPFLTPPR